MMKSPDTSERLTIMLDSDVAKKLRKLQAKKITETQGTYSFSKVINEVLKGKESI